MSTGTILRGLTICVLFHQHVLAQTLYWTQTNPAKIQRSNTDGSSVHTIYSSADIAPWGLALDPTNNFLYWGDWWVGGVRGTSLGGSVIENVFAPSLGPPAFVSAVAIDPSAAQLYWSATGTHTISRFDLSTGTHATVFTSPEASPTGLALDLPAGKLYWSDSGGYIRKSNFDGSEVETIVSGAFQPWSVAIHAAAGVIYWGDAQTGSIYRTNLDGTGTTAIITEANSIPWMVALDLSHGYLFWADKQSSSIHRANLDGTDKQQIIAGTPITTGIVVNEAAAEVYWCEGGTYGRIRRAGLDGANVGNLVNTSSGPDALAFDMENGQMYWSDNRKMEINRSNLDGSMLEPVLAGLANDAEHLVFSATNNKLYWVENVSSTAAVLKRSNIDGTGVESMLSNAGQITGLVVDSVGEKLYWVEPQPSQRRIRRADLDVVNVEVVLNTGPSPRGIALDLINQKLYWFQQTNAATREIRRANFDGTAQEAFFSTGTFFLRDMSFDAAAGRLYWAELLGANYRIRSISTNGNDVEVIVSYGANVGLRSIAIVQTQLITSALPPICAIDARQPHNPTNPASAFGWTSLDLNFSQPLPTAVNASDFTIEEVGGDELPPNITAVELLTESSVRLSFSTPIEPNSWTCVHYEPSNTHSCLGYLPGDVNGDRVTSSTDVLRLIDRLNNACEPSPPPCEYADYQTDIDRSGATDAADILRLIDLLNGAGAFEPWLSHSLPPCP